MSMVRVLSILVVIILATATGGENLWGGQGKPGSSSQEVTSLEEELGYCVLTLNSISKTKCYPGTVFEMYGVFGKTQGEKMAAINSVKEAGDQDAPLIVLSWSNTKLVAKVSCYIHPGPYKLGVYCNNPCKPGAITTVGMVWRDFEVLAKSKCSNTSFRSR